jgi:outer membrane lipoprotein carrier protein
MIGCCLALINGKEILPQRVAMATDSAAEHSVFSLDDILGRIEKRYAAPGFSTRFLQTLRLKSMDISDTASGKAYFKRPGMMRWEYEAPDRQIIVTDGEHLWIYRPDDNQVMTGKSPAFFSGGKGAGFLSDMNMIREKFDIALQQRDDTGHYLLKLVPKEKTLDVATIYISVAPETFLIDQITTYNSYGDETVFQLTDIQFLSQLDDAMFRFNIPEGAEVLQLDD